MNERMTPLAAAVFAVLYPAAAALAQQAPADATKLEQVVVTATRRNENLQDVAQSITAISTEDIEKQAFQNLPDVIGALPSVNIVNSMPGRSSVQIRGISAGSDEYRLDSQVAIYLDDQPMTSISQQVDVRLIDIARIEVLPGPQGTLFGSSSQSGTLRYITNKPEPSGFSSQLDLEVGTTKGGEESYNVSGWVNIPITDNLAVRATGYYTKEGGYVDNVLGLTLMAAAQGGKRNNANVVEKDWNDYSTAGGRIAARWTINPEWEATLSLIQQSSAADGAWETDPYLGDNKITRFFDEYRDDDWYQASMTIKGDLGFAELSVTASYFDRKIKYEWDNMTYDQWRSSSAQQGFKYAIYDTDLTFGTTYNDQKQNRWAYEVRLTSQGDSRFQWMAGAFYEDVWDWWDYGTKNLRLTKTTAWDAAQFYASQANPKYGIESPLPETNIYYSNIYAKTIKQKALFGEMTYALTDRWSATVGARWFEYDRQELDIYQFPNGLPPYDSDETDPPGCGCYGPDGRNERSGKDSEHVIKLATEFHFDDERMAYFLFSEGFRLGGSNGPRAASTGVVPLEYAPDTLKNYELGLKSRWMDNRLQLNGALFYMQWSDIQQDISTDRWWLRGRFNGTKGEQKGIELSGSWKLTDRFSLEASGFYGEPEFSEDLIYPDDSPDPTDNAVIKAGTTMPVSPGRKYWIAADYQFPRVGSLNGNLWMRWSYSYQSEFWDSIDAVRHKDANLLVPSSSTSTLQFGFDHENGWSTALVVRNLFDEKRYNYISGSHYGSDPFDDKNDGPTFSDPRYAYLRSEQRPRSISLYFSKKW